MENFAIMKYDVMLWKKGTVEEILIGRGIFEANDDWLKIYYKNRG